MFSIIECSFVGRTSKILHHSVFKVDSSSLGHDLKEKYLLKSYFQKGKKAFEFLADKEMI